MVNVLLRQVEIAKKIDTAAAIIQWNDWKWQIKHAVKDISTFERLLSMRFDADERLELEKTIRKFPLSITPYYLSLIDAGDMKNDPVYKQCFPSPTELVVEKCEENYCQCKQAFKSDCMEGAVATGIARLLSDLDETISIAPKITNHFRRHYDA